MMLKPYLNKLSRKENLTENEMVEAFNLIMSGEATQAQIGGFLAALRLKGETVEEITGAARVMREKSLKVNFQAPVVVDTCGTGGDGANTFNISTTAAFIVAAAGAPVAKHGNRAMSSRCGSADLLEALKIKVDLPPEKVELCLREAGIGFMFAPAFHQAMKYAIGPRRELGFRTIFNVLGPLTNPASANCQLMGVFNADLTEPLAQVIQRLGVKRAMLVHGAGGLDELSLEGPNKISFLKDDVIKTFTVTATELGLETAPNQLLKGDSPEENAKLTEQILKGDEKGPRLNVVLLNAAAALIVAGLAPDLKEGIQLARKVIADGSAYAKLKRLQEFVA
ncbi:MAG TPA: anthranilate phosphoribosyltransferase [Bacillota bacterium]|nr:anthranilate phosphoribosyltransferase [Bacillota bacterium]